MRILFALVGLLLLVAAVCSCGHSKDEHKYGKCDSCFDEWNEYHRKPPLCKAFKGARA